MSSYLLKHKDNYYFRIWIPLDVRHHFSSAEIKRSLHTRNFKLAKSQASLWSGKVEQVFITLRANVLDLEQIPSYINSTLPSPRNKQQKSKAEKLEKQVLQIKGKKLKQVVEAYIQEHMTLKKWTEKTVTEASGQLDLFMKVVGNVSLVEIDRTMMVDYLETVKKLPAGINKNPAYRGKTIKELLATPNLPPMSTTTINKYIERAGSLLIWCMKQEYIDRNPAMGLSIAKTTKDDEQRAVYSVADLELIKKMLPNVDTNKPERYWIPRIAMYTGLRLNEICQLHLEDVIEIDGIWCFDINDDKDKRLKNIASKRIVPVHPILIKLGFHDYVEKLRADKVERLWINLTKGRDGHSHDFGHWFSRFNRSKITKDPLKVFHSFRHTVADTLKQSGIAEGVIAEILGHANDSITTGRYGKRYRPQVLLDALMKLEY